MNGLSLFSSAGIGETYLSQVGINIKVSNELLEKRANLYKSLYPSCNVITGDITNKKIFDQIIKEAKSENIEFIIASPPCQGLSVAGKNRNQIYMASDKRNYLINYVFEVIDILEPKFVLIENVPMLLKFLLPYENKNESVLQIMHQKYNDKYHIEGQIVDSADYGVPQTRLRAIIKLYKKEFTWPWPNKERKITVRESIGNLPSIEAGEKSTIKWHFARNHSPNHILWMKHTETGSTAFENDVFYPQKQDGTPVKGYHSSYRRIKWDEPAPTITIRNDAISSQRNVHPGRLLDDGTYSDARVLTPLELMRLSSLPDDWNIPNATPEILIRQVIGESIPPLMIKKIVEQINAK